MSEQEKDGYRTAADAPEPEWRELTSFAVNVERLDVSEGVTLVCWANKNALIVSHTLKTKDTEAKKLFLGQRVRVVLQVLK